MARREFTSIRALLDRYRGNSRVRINYFDNSGGNTRRVNEIPHFDYNMLPEKLHEILEAELKAGTITQAQYAAFGGRAVSGQHRKDR